MLGNLQELHYNLTSLIQQFSDIRGKLINPLEAKKSNQHSLLIKIPKVILIIRVCPYLDYSDVVNLSTVSTTLRKSIFSPIGWKLLSRIHSPYPIIIREIAGDELKYNPHDYQHMDAMQYNLPQDEKNLRKSRLQCKKELMQFYEKYKQKQEEYYELEKKVKSQKTHIKKLLMQKQYFKKKEELLHEQNLSYRNELKSINVGFTQKIKQLDKQNEELIEQNNKLQNQKGALVNKIRQYQNQIQVIKSQSDKYKAILKRIKNYLLYKQL